MTAPNIANLNTNSFYTQISTPQKAVTQPVATQPQETKPQKDEFQATLFDKISEKVVNPRDINDMVNVPRCIFKGYLGFMLGATLMTVASIAESTKLLKSTAPALKLAGQGLMAVGTFEFVKPFMLKAKEEKQV